MRTQTFLIIASLLTTLALQPSQALANCGDDIDGERVPCACGDIVVADTKLIPGDPVIAEPCISDGLAIRARAGAQSISLDLNGQSLQGTGGGIGVRVIYGGTNGAVIKGSGATISRFAVGISARGRNLLASLDGVVASHNTGDGIVVNGEAAKLTNVAATHNGGDGVALGGRGSTAKGVRTANNDGQGVKLRGAGNRASGTSIGDGIAPGDVSERNSALNANNIAVGGE